MASVVVAAMAVLVGTTCAVARGEPLPVVKLEHAPLKIERSCRVEFAPGAVFENGGDEGVIRVEADGVVVEFADGSVLRGAPAERAQDVLVGTGIVVEGHDGVTLRGVNVTGFKVGVRAARANGLVIDGLRAEGMYAQRLKSTPAAEDSGDWLWPHRNDGDEWTKTYGAALSVKESSHVCIHDVRVRRGQNGILLSRVDDSRVFDCDCSFLSGWGLGMWRSSKNIVSRNALDFCIRGYSHGVYNRGQDSAGILMFEQCCDNVIVENSATHCGDGFFGFAGRDALGEAWAEGHKDQAVPTEEVERHRRLGCNGNLLLDNDFSYAAAHGIEMTFSFGNRFIGNRLVENGICGVWGGYSAETVIASNVFAGNGGAGGGGEGGGINIEHGRENVIARNTFDGDTVGVKLWAKNGEALARLPWGLANGEKEEDGTVRVPSARNVINGNGFEGVGVRGASKTGVAGAGSRDIEAAAEEFSYTMMEPAGLDAPKVAAPGARRPVGARMELEGRDRIVMGEFGPWDHESVLVAKRGHSERGDVYDVYGGKGDVLTTAVLEGEVRARVQQIMSLGQSGHGEVYVEPNGEGASVRSYRVRVSNKPGTFSADIAGTIVTAAWDVRVWSWQNDPLTDAAAWRAEADGRNVVRAKVGGIDWALGYNGPGCIGPEVAAAKIGPNHYGVIAGTRIKLGVGTWVVKTLSDDGIRVTADGKTIIERWDIHGPTADQGQIVVEKEREVEIGVKYFQNDGFAVLRVGIERENRP
jgi:parallel beta-helix repeat protein